MGINLTTLPSNIGGVSVPVLTRGPLAALFSNKFDKAQYRYPRDLGTNPARKHSVVFTVMKNQPQQVASLGPEFSESINSMGTSILDTAQNIDLKKSIGENVSNVITGAYELGSKASGAVGAFSKGFIKLNRVPDVTIGLYMPDTVNTTYSSVYDDNESLSSNLGRFYFLAQGASSLSNAFKDMKDRSLTNIVNAVGNDPYVRDFVFSKIGELTGTNLARMALNAGGYAMNPQLQVLFRSIGFRSFQFDFAFTPYSKEEAQTILEIIKRFKFHSAPRIMQSKLPGAFEQGMYFEVPDAFDIKFYYGNEENTNIHKIGECVLENVVVDYAGSGQWSTFNDGFPSQIKLTLQFKETVIVDKNRIDAGY